MNERGLLTNIMPNRDPTRYDTFRAFGLMLPTWVVLGALYLLPLVILAAVSLHQADDFGNAAPVDNWGQHISSGAAAANYEKSIRSPFPPIHVRSFVLALVTTAACLILGYPVAFYIALVARPARRICSCAGGDPVLDVLSGAYRRVAADPAGSGLTEHAVDEDAHDQCAATVARHAAGGADRAGVRRIAVHDPAAVCVVGEARPFAAGGGGRSGGAFRRCVSCALPCR